MANKHNKTTRPAAAPSAVRVRQERFIAAYRVSGVIRVGCEAAGITRRTHARWLEDDDEYRALFEEAKADATELLEMEAIRRARIGVDEDIYVGGKKVGTRKVYSDSLLMFLLRGNDPAKYRDRVETTGTIGITLPTLNDDQMESAKRILTRRMTVPANPRLPAAER